MTILKLKCKTLTAHLIEHPWASATLRQSNNDSVPFSLKSSTVCLSNHYCYSIKYQCLENQPQPESMSSPGVDLSPSREAWSYGRVQALTSSHGNELRELIWANDYNPLNTSYRISGVSCMSKQEEALTQTQGRLAVVS